MTLTAHAEPLPRSSSRALNAWLRQQAAPVRTPLAAAIGAGAAGGVLLIAQAWLLARIVDAVAIGGATLATVWPWLWALLAVFVLRALAAAASEAIAFEAGARTVLRVRATLQAHLAALGPAWARTQSTGEVANTLFDAAESIARYYTGYLPQMALVVFLPLAILVFVIPADWVSALIMTISAPLIPLFMVLIGKGTESLNQTQWRKLARLSGHVFDAIEGLTTLKLFGASQAEIQTIAAMSDDYRRSTMEVLRVAFLSSLALEFFATISIAIVAVYIGIRLYFGQMQFLPGFAVLLLAPEFYRALRSMGTQYHARMEAVGAAQSIVALLETTPRATAPIATAPQTGPIHTIQFDRIGFSYGDGPVLHDIGFTLEPGTCTALVGASGAGKTTLTQLLLGFLPPTAGRILIDGTDLAAIDPAAWRRRVAWLPQRPTLFHGTVRSNICLGHPDADPAAIRAAVEQAGATDLLARLPAGLETPLGDRGQGLSGGEAQRIGLARVFLKRASLVILDEPGAGLDPDTAALVTRSVRTLARTAAVLVIAHRLETVRHADEILVLEAGRITERGHHTDLLRARGAYTRLIGAAVMA